MYSNDLRALSLTFISSRSFQQLGDKHRITSVSLMSACAVWHREADAPSNWSYHFRSPRQLEAG